MWEQIKSFFAWLFGQQTEEETSSLPSPEGTPEDAADLGEVEVLSVENPSEQEMQARNRRTGTRGLNVGEVIEVSTIEDAPTAPVQITNPKFFWLLDNGHGKLQAGKRSPLFADGSQFEEWEFNRDIVARMIPRLESTGIQFMNVVPEEEVGSFLRERVKRANDASSPLFGKSNRIFLSIHANALGMGTWMNGAKGIEVWHYPGNDTGKRLASAFQEALLKRLPGWTDRGIKSHQRGSRKIFYVLANTAMPAILTENGFYTDENEASLLMKPEIRQAIADAHVDAMIRIEQNGFQNVPIYKPNMVIGG